MSHLRTAVFDAVQAVLLNSECHPRDAVNAALEAVAQFADGESLLKDGADSFAAIAREAWANRPEVS